MEEKIQNLLTTFNAFYNYDAELVCSCGGRFEILGNHTDHNHGLCIASACNLEIVAAVKKRKDKQVNLKSLGFPMNEVDLNLDKNYVFISVTENIPMVKNIDVMIDPCGDIYNNETNTIISGSE